MPLTIPQQTIFDSPARFKCVSAGRRFGKSYLSMWEIARVARNPKKNICYVSPTYRMSKQIMFDMLEEELTKVNWLKKANVSDLTFILVNGSKIMLRSGENYDSLRGISLDLVIMDEASYIEPEAWTKVLRPTLSDRQGTAMFISTPNGRGNWFYDLYNHAKNTTDWAAFQFTTAEGGNVPAVEIEAARADLDAKSYSQEYLATFETAGNNVFYAFHPDASVQKYTGEMPRDIIVGMDFNISPMSAVIGINTGDGIHIIDEIVLRDSNTEEMAQELKRRYGHHRVTVFPDPAGAARKTSAVGKTDHTILHDAGFIVKSPRGHDPVKDGINATNRLLCDAAGNRRLFVDPKCKETIECFNKFQYKEGTNNPDKSSGYDHLMDAVRYAVNYLYPIKKIVDTKDKVRTFGHF